MSQVIDRRVAAEFRNQVARLQIASQSDGRILHPERLQNLLLDHQTIGAPARIQASDRFTHQGVVDERGVVDPHPGRFLREDVGADRGDHFIESIDIHAGAGRVDARHSRAVREQVKIGQGFAPASLELRNDIDHPRRQREPAVLDGLEHENVGEGLRDREQAEHRIRGDWTVGRGSRTAEGLLESDLPVPRHDERGAVVAALDDVLFHGSFERHQARAVQAPLFGLRHRSFPSQ